MGKVEVVAVVSSMKMKSPIKLAAVSQRTLYGLNSKPIRNKKKKNCGPILLYQKMYLILLINFVTYFIKIITLLHTPEEKQSHLLKRNWF